MANAYAELTEIRNGRKIPRGRVDNPPFGPGDADAARELLRRLAKENGVKPESCEIFVRDGRRMETYRL